MCMGIKSAEDTMHTQRIFLYNFFDHYVKSFKMCLRMLVIFTSLTLHIYNRIIAKQFVKEATHAHTFNKLFLDDRILKGFISRNNRESEIGETKISNRSFRLTTYWPSMISRDFQF